MLHRHARHGTIQNMLELASMAGSCQDAGIRRLGIGIMKSWRTWNDHGRNMAGLAAAQRHQKEFPIHPARGVWSPSILFNLVASLGQLVWQHTKLPLPRLSATLNQASHTQNSRQDNSTKTIIHLGGPKRQPDHWKDYPLTRYPSPYLTPRT
jgi:hypothetical protein